MNRRYPLVIGIILALIAGGVFVSVAAQETAPSLEWEVTVPNSRSPCSVFAAQSLGSRFTLDIQWSKNEIGFVFADDGDDDINLWIINEDGDLPPKGRVFPPDAALTTGAPQPCGFQFDQRGRGILAFHPSYNDGWSSQYIVNTTHQNGGLDILAELDSDLVRSSLSANIYPASLAVDVYSNSSDPNPSFVYTWGSVDNSAQGGMTVWDTADAGSFERECKTGTTGGSNIHNYQAAWNNNGTRGLYSYQSWASGQNQYKYDPDTCLVDASVANTVSFGLQNVAYLTPVNDQLIFFEAQSTTEGKFGRHDLDSMAVLNVGRVNADPITPYHGGIVALADGDVLHCDSGDMVLRKLNFDEPDGSENVDVNWSITLPGTWSGMLACDAGDEGEVVVLGVKDGDLVLRRYCCMGTTVFLPSDYEDIPQIDGTTLGDPAPSSGGSSGSTTTSAGDFSDTFTNFGPAIGFVSTESQFLFGLIIVLIGMTIVGGAANRSGGQRAGLIGAAAAGIGLSIFMSIIGYWDSITIIVFIVMICAIAVWLVKRQFFGEGGGASGGE